MYGSPACNAGSRFPRLTLWILVSVFLLVALALAAPEQMPVLEGLVAQDEVGAPWYLRTASSPSYGCPKAFG